MAWEPQFKVIDARYIGRNILDYIELHQEEALAWADGGAGIEPFAKFYTNASGRLQTIFPSLIILSQSLETDLESDQIPANLQFAFEATMAGSDPDQLVADTKIYAMAIESMLLNISSDELTNNSYQYHKGYPMEIETRFDILRGHKAAATAFLQIFQTRVKYRLQTAGV